MFDVVVGSSFQGLRLFQFVSVCFKWFSFVTSWCGLFHVAAVDSTSVGCFML